MNIFIHEDNDFTAKITIKVSLYFELFILENWFNQRKDFVCFINGYKIIILYIKIY